MMDIEPRITARMNRARLAVEGRRALRPLAVTALGITLALAGCMFLVSHISKSVYTSHHEVRFMVDDATGIVPGRAEVRVKGIPAGTVTKSEYVGGQAVLTAQIYDKFGDVYRDARAVIRPNTPLQDMFLNVTDRGTRTAGIADATHPLSPGQTDSSVNVADVLQAFSPGTRGNMRRLLTNLGGGLDGRGRRLQQLFVEVAPFVQAATKVTSQLEVRTARTKRFVTNFEALTGELARRDTALRSLTRNGGQTLAELEHDSPDLDATLQELPPTLRAIDSSFTAVREVLPQVDGAVRSLRPVAGELPAGLTALRSLSDAARPAFASLQTPVRRLVPLATSLRPAAASLDTALIALRPQLGAIDHVVKSVSGCTLAGYLFFQNTASVVKMGDTRGAYPRGDAILSLGSLPNGKDANQHPVGGCAPGSPKTNQP